MCWRVHPKVIIQVYCVVIFLYQQFLVLVRLLFQPRFSIRLKHYTLLFLKFIYPQLLLLACFRIKFEFSILGGHSEAIWVIHRFLNKLPLAAHQYLNRLFNLGLFEVFVNIKLACVPFQQNVADLIEVNSYGVFWIGFFPQPPLYNFRSHLQSSTPM